jgi:hypothetical protein
MENFPSLLHSMPCNISISHAEISWIVMLVAMLGATYVMEQVRSRWARKVELDGWVRQALKDRESQMHQVLTLDEDHIDTTEEFLLLSAAETRERILSGKLDPQQNIRDVAKRCRTYGRAVEGANAVTVEMYDEVSSKVSSILF